MIYPELKTNRLTLRPVKASDQQQVFEGFSHPEVNKYFGITYSTFDDTAEQMNWYAKNAEEGTGYSWVVTNDAGDFMGVFSIYYIHPIHKRAEVGYWLMPDYWNQGIASEALQTLLIHAKTNLKLHRVAAEVEPENKTSIELLKKNGFERDGILRDMEFKHGKYIHLEIWSIILQ
ncbi:MAG: GNAT family N-acetyltransferase [Bacteroidia bacterium]|jgi:ribosomal-protein-alanine N-acetyltransferase|nr:GNAT family N-acetyltransferase [Bacteroidia bacterium]